MWLHVEHSCVYFCLSQTEKDILLWDELKDVQKNHPEKVKVWYTLDKPSKGETAGNKMFVRVSL